MANITFPWNPFQDQILCRVKGEVIKTSTDGKRRIFVPRAAPFFMKNVVLRKQGSVTPLNPGSDFLYAHTFDRFIVDKRRNVAGAIVLRKDFENEILVMDYDTIGGPFILDEVAFVQLVANIVNAPREADWSDLVGVPEEWPADPHDHPPVQGYDYEDMYLALKHLILIMSDSETNGASLMSLLEDHLKKPILQAHTGNKADLGLPDTANLRPSVVADIAGGEPGVALTMDVALEMFRRAAKGTLNLN